jgi:WD40 repeat protein
MEVQHTLTYNGVPLCMLDEDTVMYPAGNAVAFAGSQTSQSFVKSSTPGGISAIASNWTTKSIALAPRTKNPEIQIISHIDQQRKATLKDGTSLEYSAVAFTRDGSRVLGVGTLTDFQLTVWGVKDEKKLCTEKMPYACDFGSFNPAGGDDICTGGKNGLCFWKLVNILGEKFELKQTACELPADGDNNELRSQFTCHCWTAADGVWAGNAAGEIMLFKQDQTAPAEIIKLSGDNVCANAVLISRDHLIVATSDGEIQWFALDGEHVSQQTVALPNDADGAPANVSSMSASPFFEKVTVGTKGGKMYSVKLPVDEPNEEEPAEEALEVANFHGAAITGSAVMNTGDSQVIATAGLDGAVKVWTRSSKDLLVERQFGDRSSVTKEALTCMKNRGEEPLLAVGSNTGVLRFLTVVHKHKTAEVLLSHAVKLCQHSIMEVVWHPTKPWVAVPCVEDGSVFVIDVRAEGEFDSIGYCNIDQHFTVSWNGSSLIIAMEDGELQKIDISGTAVGAPGNKFTPQPFGRLDDNQGHVSRVAIRPEANDMFVISPSKTALLHYPLPTSPETVLQPIGAYAAHHKGITCVQTMVVKKPFESMVGYIATGGLEGMVVLWGIFAEGGKTSVRPINQHILHSSPIISLNFSADASTLVSTEVDGSCHIWNVRATTEDVHVPIPVSTLLMPSYTRKAYALAEGADMFQASDPTYIDRVLQAKADEEETAHKRVREHMEDKLGELSTRLDKVVSKNSRVADLEKMEREEFVVDLEAQISQVEKNDVRALEVRHSILDHNHSVNLVTKRIREECWDSMEVPAKELHALKSGVVVRHFPIRKLGTQEQKKLDKVKVMRRIELREVKEDSAGQRNWQSDLQEVPADINWLINVGALEASLDPAKQIEERAAKEKAAKEGKPEETKKTKKDDDEDEEEGGDAAEKTEEDDAKEETLVDMLYHPAALRTPVQKCRQIMLLKALVQENKLAFNQRFTTLYDHKDDRVSTIDSMNVRIKEILAELETTKDFLQPKWAAMERPEGVLEVTAAEMTKKPYETEGMKKIRLAAEAAEEERLKLAAKDDIGGRALQDMMNGTLEMKKEVSHLQEELVAEEWMTEIAYADMDADQHKLVHEFEDKVKAREEEKEKQRKAFELELKKNNTEIAEICRVFDEKVDQLFTLYNQVNMSICVQELYIHRLGLSVSLKRADGRLITKTDQELATVGEERQVLLQKIAAYRPNLDSAKEAFEALHVEDRAQERNFKKELQEAVGVSLDQDAIKILITLFKLRTAAGKAEQDRTANPGSTTRQSYRASGSHNLVPQGRKPSFAKAKKKEGEDTASPAAAGNPIAEAMQAALVESAKRTGAYDPYAVLDDAKEKKGASNQLSSSAPLDMEKDCPEGFVVDDAVWQKMSELRSRKIDQENTIKLKTADVAELQEEFDLLEKSDATLQKTIKQLAGKKKEYTTRKDYYDVNLEVLVAMKQGQDEMTQDPVMVDYTDAMLVSREVVEVKNAEITGLGKEKVAILSKIKNFRKNINYMLWEHKFLEETSTDLEEHYTDLHMLRVTKDLQAFIKGGDTANQQQLDIKKAEEKLEHLIASHATKLKKIQTLNNKFKHQHREKKEENSRLSVQIQQLDQNVQMRESIHASRFESQDESQVNPSQETMNRMKTIMMRRKLIDLARAQTDEIEFLRGELDRLRQRTFPSFSQGARGGAD